MIPSKDAFEEHKKTAYSGYVRFKDRIAKDLSDIYGFNIVESKQLIYQKYEQLIEQDIEWSQHMGTEYWAEVINYHERIKVKGSTKSEWAKN